MKAYLVEAYSPDIEFDKNSMVIALTPEVCYQLNKAGIKYSIIEDYYDEMKLSASVDEYYEAQLRWIDSLDEFLQSNVKELKELSLKLGAIYYYYLKTMVLDPLYIRCYTLSRLFEAIKPSSVIFISHPPEETPLDYRLQSGGKSYYSQVVPILCHEKDIPLTSVCLESNSKAMKETKPALSIGNLINWLKDKLYRSATVRRIYYTCQYFRQRLSPKPKNPDRLSILMLKLVHIGIDFVIGAIRKGHTVYQLSGDSILKYSSLGARSCLYLETEYKDKATDLKNDSLWENTTSLLEGHDLIKWVNKKCQLDVSGVVLPKLQHFVSKVCPEILKYFRVFNKFYKKNKVDFVITPDEVSPIEFAAIAAANYSERANTVHISHGNSAYDIKFGRIIQLTHSNILISSSLEEKEYSRYLCQVNNFPTELYSSPDRLLPIKKIGYLRERNKGNIKKNRIIYLPTLMTWDTRRVEGDIYPDTWYYQFQKSLIEYFSTKNEYTFVWKGLPSADAILNPIPNFVRDNNFGNIEVATDPFLNHLLSADRVICDYPSTGFYESIVAGVPTMSLYHRTLIVRKSAIDYFGNLLKPFSDIPEAIQHIDEFLSSDPELYKTTIELGDSGILDILEEIGGK